jgi:hypothetical protein
MSLTYDEAPDIVRRIQQIEAAKKAVHPVVGDVGMALDSEAVYIAALTRMGHDTKPLTRVGNTGNAAEQIFRVLSRRSAKPRQVAMDATAKADFEARFPNANRLARV